MRTGRWIPGHATIVAYLALLVALGGTSVAAVQLARNSVKSRHIARGEVKRSDLGRNAVTSAKVRDGSLLGVDFAPGQLPAGPKGDTGARGPQGGTGAPGAPGATKVVYRRAEIDVTGASTWTPVPPPTCQPGETLIGGGGGHVLSGTDSFNPGGTIAWNGPFSGSVLNATDDQQTPTGWSIGVHTTGAGGKVVSYAICASP
jgi:hypothetical protein